MIDTVEDVAAFTGLRGEWNRLLEGSASNCFFLTWEWLYTWWKHLAGDRRLSIVTLRRDGELVAIAPLALRTRGPRGLPLRTLEFLGTGAVSSDHLDLVVRRGMEPEAAAALGEHLARRKLVVKLDHLDRSGSQAAQVGFRLGPRGWRASEAPMFRCPFIDLGGHSWESYLATLSPKHRSDLQRRLRKLDKEFEVRLEWAASDEQRRRSLALLFELHDRRWRQRGGSGAFHTPALRAFHEEVTGLALERGWLRLFVLWLGDKAAGARYGFRYGTTYYSYQSGFDPAYGKLGIGLITVALAIRTAIAEGAGEYDMLAGNEPYKSRLAHQARELVRLELFPPGARGLFCRHALGLGRAFRSAVRRASWRPLVTPLLDGLGDRGQETVGVPQHS